MKLNTYIGRFEIVHSEKEIFNPEKLGKLNKAKRLQKIEAKRSKLEELFMYQAGEAKKDEKNKKRYSAKYAKRK